MKMKFIILLVLISCLACNPWKRDFPPPEYVVKGRIFDKDGITPLTNFKLELHHFSFNYFHAFDTTIATTVSDMNGFFSITYPHIKKWGGELKITDGKTSYYAGIEKNTDFERDIIITPYGTLDVNLLNLDKLKSFDTLYFGIGPLEKINYDSIPYKTKGLKGIVLTFHHDNSRVKNLKLLWDGDYSIYGSKIKRYKIVWGLGYEKFISNYEDYDQHIWGEISGFPYKDQITLDVLE